MARTSVGFLRAAALLWAMTSPVAATQLLSANELADLFQSTAVRMDLALLPYLEAFPGSLKFDYASSPGAADWANWSGVLNGDYGPQKLNLSYADGALDLAAGTSSWNTAGTLGGGAATGGGSVSILYPTGSTFALTLIDSLSFGGVTASADVTFSGTLLSPANFMLGSPGDPGSGSGTITLAGQTITFPPPDCLFHCKTYGAWTLFGGHILSAMTYEQDGGDYTIYDYFPPGTVLQFSCNSPEPATWAMLIMGFAAIGLARRRGVRAALTQIIPGDQTRN